MKISSKLTAFFICVVIIFAGLAMTLLGQMQAVSRGYDALLAGPVRQADAARVIQVNFKKQVQEWKDILLRGHTPADLRSTPSSSMRRKRWLPTGPGRSRPRSTIRARGSCSVTS